MGGGVAGGVVFLVVLFILVKVLHITEMGGLLTPITRRLRRR